MKMIALIAGLALTAHAQQPPVEVAGPPADPIPSVSDPLPEVRLERAINEAAAPAAVPEPAAPVEVAPISEPVTAVEGAAPPATAEAVAPVDAVVVPATEPAAVVDAVVPAAEPVAPVEAVAPAAEPVAPVEAAAPAEPAAQKVEAAAPLEPVAAAEPVAAVEPAAAAEPAASKSAVVAPARHSLCPANAGVGKPRGFMSSKQACDAPTQSAGYYEGVTQCFDKACCKCYSIVCGNVQGFPCRQLEIGDFGAVGVKHIWARGDPLDPTGLSVECNGLMSCMDSSLDSIYAHKAQCGARGACQGATLRLFDPQGEFSFQAAGQSSMQNAVVEMIFGDATATECIPTGVPRLVRSIEISGVDAASGATLRVSNHGCDPVIIESFKCGGPLACRDLKVEFTGDVQMIDCFLPGLLDPSTLPLPMRSVCQLGLLSAAVPGQLPPATPLTGANPPAAVASAHPAAPSTLPATGGAATLPATLPATGGATPPNAPSNPSAASTPAQTHPLNAVMSQLLPNANPSALSNALSGLMSSLSLQQQQQMAQTAPGEAILTVQSPAKLMCDGNPTLCTSKSIKLKVQNNFVLECPDPASCVAMNLDLEVGVDPKTGDNVQKIDSLKFVGKASGAGSVIRLTDTRFRLFTGQILPDVIINDVSCENDASCVGLKIFAGPGIRIGNMDCSEPRHCLDCQITEGEFTRPCASVV